MTDGYPDEKLAQIGVLLEAHVARPLHALTKEIERCGDYIKDVHKDTSDIESQLYQVVRVFKRMEKRLASAIEEREQ